MSEHSHYNGEHSHHSSHHSHSSSRAAVRYKNIISFIMAVFIGLGLCMSLVCFVMKGGLLNNTTLKQSLNESNYYSDKADRLEEALKKRVKEAGLPETIAEDVITDRMVTIHANKIINEGVNGKVTKLDTSEMETKLREGIEAYVKMKNIEMNDDMTNSIDILLKETTSEYATQMTFNFVNVFNIFSEKYIGTINILIIVGIAVCVICTIVLLVIHRRKYRGLRYSAYGVLAGSILSGVVSLLMRSSIMKAVPSGSEAYYEVIRTYISNSFGQAVYICLAGIFIFCLFTAVTGYLRKEAI